MTILIKILYTKMSERTQANFIIHNREILFINFRSILQYDYFTLNYVNPNVLKNTDKIK